MPPAGLLLPLHRNEKVRIGNASGSYKWQRDGADIAGATAASYLLVAADSTHNITAVVTTTNKYGSTPASSNTIHVT